MRLELFDRPLDRQQPVLEAGNLGVVTQHAQRSLTLHALEIESPTDRVAEELLTALLEGEKEAALADGGAAVEELCNSERLARARRPGDEDHGVAEEAAAAHLIELLIARRDANVRRLLLELSRRAWNDDQSAV